MTHRKNTLYDVPLHLSAIILFFDICALVLSFLLCIKVNALYQNDLAPAIFTIAFKSYVLLSVIIITVFIYRGHYRKRLPYWQQVGTILKSVLVILFVTMLSYLVFEFSQFPLIIILCWLIVSVFLITARKLSLCLVPHFKEWTLPVVLLGNNQMIIDCMYAFYNDRNTGFEVKIFMLRDKTKKPICFDFVPEDHPHIDLVDASGDNFDFILNHKKCFYIIDMEGLRGKNRDKLINLLEINNIDYAIVPSTKRLHLYGMKPSYFFGNDVIMLHSYGQHTKSFYLKIKRLIDIFVSLCFLPLLALLTLTIFLIKKVEGIQTPLFYDGKRVGVNGNEFNCWKFTTMRPNADQILNELIAQDSAKKEEWDNFQKLKNDPRIDSRISNFLRKTSLDEFPQIWNVFIGDMSLVGPRPILPEQRIDYKEYLPLYQSVKPGITGLWQVSGRNETQFQQRIYWDSWYVKNWSLWHDIVILLKTISVLISKRGAG